MDEIVLQLGLILSQVRFTRRAVEDIERSTARYGSFAFSSALQAGPKFGEPPMAQGALKVFVVNLQDLAPSSGLGGLFGALMGGIGRFAGGLVGGAAGGTLSALILPFMLKHLARIAEAADRIIERLGIGKQSNSPENKAIPAPGLDLGATLQELKETFKTITLMFGAAKADPEQGRGQSLETPADERWTALLKTIHALLEQVRLVVDGLIPLIGIAVGALAFLIVKLDTLKLAFLDLMQFLLRNTLMVRALVFTVINDTIGAVAPLMASVLGVLSVAVQKILTGAFGALGGMLELAIDMIRPIGKALRIVLDGLVDWMAGPLLGTLARVADSVMFRVLTHLIRILPAVLPPLYELLRDKKATTALSPEQIGRLSEATQLAIPGPAYTGKVTPPGGHFPDFASQLVGDADIFSLPSKFRERGEEIAAQGKGVLTTTITAIEDIQKAVKAAADDQKSFGTKLDAQIAIVQGHAQKIADALAPKPEDQRASATSGLDVIATQFAAWFSGGGLGTVMQGITDHFKANPALLDAVAKRHAATDDGAGRLPVTVEIGNVSVVITSKPSTAPGKSSAIEPELGPRRMTLEDLHEFDQRGGGVTGEGPLFPQFGSF